MQGRNNNVVQLHPTKTIEQDRARLFKMFFLSLSENTQKKRITSALEWRNQMDLHFAEYQHDYFSLI